MSEHIETASLEDVTFGVSRLPLDDTLMTILLLSEQPFIAIDASIQGSRAAGEAPTFMLVRVEERWSRA